MFHAIDGCKNSIRATENCREQLLSRFGHLSSVEFLTYYCLVAVPSNVGDFPPFVQQAEHLPRDRR